MKTFWTEETVNKHGAGWLDYTQADFEGKTDVWWSVCHQFGGYQFHPTGEGIAAASDMSEEEQFLMSELQANPKVGKEYVSYLIAADVTGLPLRRLIEIVKLLEKNGLALRAGDRMGKDYAFKIR